MHNLRDRLTQFEYSEAKYYAAFRTEPPRRAFAYLNPAKGSVRLFLPLDPSDAPCLLPTPSTSSWAARFPSVFPIAGEQDLSTATRLIVKSHAAIGPSTRKKATRRPEYLAAEELPSEIEYVEGAARPVLVNAYERNRRAREKCLRHYGRICAVCGFNFEARYGESAAGYILVLGVVRRAHHERRKEGAWLCAPTPDELNSEGGGKPLPYGAEIFTERAISAAGCRGRWRRGFAPRGRAGRRARHSRR